MGRFINENGNKILSVVGVVAALCLVLLIGNNIIESKENEAKELENEVVYTTTVSQAEEEEELVDKVALPDIIYASVGEPLVIRFLNITGFNSLQDFSMKVETGGKGKVFADRWEYTPQRPESVSLSFEVKDSQGVLVNRSTHIIEVKEPQKTEQASVLVIGDSTVEAGRETENMLKLAKEDGFNLKLLGSVSQDWLKDPNNRHKGRGGWKAVTYVEKSETKNTGAVNAFFNPETESFDFAYYMNKQDYDSVDYVFLQLGINDVFGAFSDKALNSSSFVKAYLKNMDILIESIHAYDPNIKIVWNLILPCSVEQEKFDLAYDNGQTADRCKRNSYLTNLAIIEHVNGMDNVFIAPTNAVLDTINDMADAGSGAVHPGKKGYYAIGQLLYNYVRALDSIEDTASLEIPGGGY